MLLLRKRLLHYMKNSDQTIWMRRYTSIIIIIFFGHDFEQQAPDSRANRSSAIKLVLLCANKPYASLKRSLGQWFCVASFFFIFFLLSLSGCSVRHGVIREPIWSHSITVLTGEYIYIFFFVERNYNKWISRSDTCTVLGTFKLRLEDVCWVI